MATATEATASYWDESAAKYGDSEFKIYWETLDQVAHYQFACMTGDATKGYLQYTIEQLSRLSRPGGLRGLSIGCGEGATPEMVLAETGLFREFEVMDIAEGLLARQQQIARQRGLESIAYKPQDLNRMALSPGTYDLIWAVGTVHHIENLENFYEQINRALTDDGLFVLREYVGPNRIQFTDEQLALVDEILACLPAKYRTTPAGQVKVTEPRPDVEALIRVDPSESVRSADVLPLLMRTLEVVQLSKTGGTILFPLLNGIASNFERDECGAARTAHGDLDGAGVGAVRSPAQRLRLLRRQEEAGIGGATLLGPSVTARFAVDGRGDSAPGRAGAPRPGVGSSGGGAPGPGREEPQGGDPMGAGRECSIGDRAAAPGRPSPGPR